MMGNAKPLLPAGFEALEPFVDKWALADADDRAKARLDASLAEREAFYQACMPVYIGALEYLDGKTPSQFDASEQRLMNVLLSFAHVSLSIEVQGADEPMHAEFARHITIVRTPDMA